MALEGVEELTKLLQRLFFKVSAAINSCVIFFEFYSHERGKDVRLMLTIQSLEYGNEDGALGEGTEKLVKIRNYRVELQEREHKVVEEKPNGEDDDDGIYTEKSVLLSGGGGEGTGDHVKLRFNNTYGIPPPKKKNKKRN